MLLDNEIGPTNVIGMNTMTPHPAALSLTSFSLLLSRDHVKISSVSSCVTRQCKIPTPRVTVEYNYSEIETLYLQNVIFSARKAGLLKLR